MGQAGNKQGEKKGALSAAWPDGTVELTETDVAHLDRMLRGEQRFRVVVIINLLVATALTTYWSLSGHWSGARAVVLVLILLSARAHLRHRRSAQLLRRLTASRDAD